VAPSTVAANNKGAAHVQPILLDEELWFGSTNHAAAENAAANSMAATAGKILGAKSMPEATRSLAELASKQNSRVDEIVEVMEQDPALSAKLLRFVNSAAFALRQPCTSVRHAVTIVGTKRLYQMATTAAVLDLFDSTSGPAVAILEHSAVVGAFCRYLGTHLGLAADELFTLGVLHDLGKLMLLETSGDAYGFIFDQCCDNPETLFTLERFEYGFDHGVLAAHVLKAWNIPDPIPKIVAWHHEPAKAYASSTAHAWFVQVLRLADTLEHAMAGGRTRAELGVIVQHDAASYLEISEAQLDAMWEDLTELRSRTLSQKRGDSDSAGPTENESATRVQTVRPQHEAASEHKNISCVECGSPSFGASCPACGGYVCPNHPIGEGGWCNLCNAEYPGFAATIPFSLNASRGVMIAIVITAASCSLGWSTSASGGLVRGIVLGVFLAVLGLSVAVISRRAVTHSRFRRTRPHRASAVQKTSK
jgi:HD-like signal output (HDOD) protein